VQICGDVFLVDGIWVDAFGREVGPVHITDDYCRK
jgi:hypothetical protein